jgi:uncharacterized protein YuzE
MHSSIEDLGHESSVLRGDTDTMYIEFRDSDIAETKDLDENTVLDLDDNGNVCAITLNMRASAPTCIV